MKPTVAIRQGARFLPYHEYRERWLDNEWSWYEGTPSAETDQPELIREDVLTLIHERQAEIASEVGRQMQSGRGRLYEMLADLTDEDGALTELEDLDDLWNGDDFSF